MKNKTNNFVYVTLSIVSILLIGTGTFFHFCEKANIDSFWTNFLISLGCSIISGVIVAAFIELVANRNNEIKKHEKRRILFNYIPFAFRRIFSQLFFMSSKDMHFLEGKTFAESYQSLFENYSSEYSREEFNGRLSYYYELLRKDSIAILSNSTILVNDEILTEKELYFFRLLVEDIDSLALYNVLDDYINHLYSVFKDALAIPEIKDELNTIVEFANKEQNLLKHITRRKQIINEKD